MRKREGQETRLSSARSLQPGPLGTSLHSCVSANPGERSYCHQERNRMNIPVPRNNRKSMAPTMIVIIALRSFSGLGIEIPINEMNTQNAERCRSGADLFRGEGSIGGWLTIQKRLQRTGQPGGEPRDFRAATTISPNPSPTARSHFP